jgi:hypothetical protein
MSLVSGSMSPQQGESSGWETRNDLQIRRVAINISNKQSRIADKGGPPAWGLGELATTSHLKTLTML